MRKAAKILNIIAIVCGFVGSVAFLIYGIICFVQAGEYGGYAGEALTIAGGTYIGCIPLWVVYIVTGFLYKKADENARSKEDMHGWGIAMIFLSIPLVGILTLCAPDSDYGSRRRPAYRTSNPYASSTYRPVGAAPVAPTPTPAPAPAKTNVEDVKSELLKAKELLDAGVISQEDYDEIKKKLISKI